MKQYLKCLIVAALVALAVTAPQKATPPVAIEKAPEGQISAANTVVPDPPKPKPVAVSTPSPTQSVPSGSCADEVRKYGWNHTVALNVMGAESSGNVATRNDNPGTGDYSIGCFQINLKGESNLNAKYRDSVALGYTGPKDRASLEAWLKNARNNVAVAHLMWSGQGWGPWGATTCRYKVACY